MPKLKDKHIAVVCNYKLRPDRIGGMDRFFKAFDVKVKDKGYTVDWYFTGYDEFDFYENLTIINSEGNPIEAFTLNYIQSHQLKYDVIVTHFTELCTSFYKSLKKLTGAYVIAVDHNPRPLLGFSLKKQLKNRLKGWLYGDYIDHFIGVSRYTMKHILKDYGAHLQSKTTVIYNGIDTKVFEKRNQPNTNKFIVASHLRPSKGIQDLLLALSKMDSSLSKTLIIDIYGEGPMASELELMSANLGLERIVHFKGSSSHLHLLFKDYSYMIQPTYMECFSLSLLESLSANVPVITTQVGGNLELIKDGVNGFVFEAGKTDSLVKIMEGIVSGKLKLSHDVSLLVESEFTLEKMVDEHYNLLPCI